MNLLSFGATDIDAPNAARTSRGILKTNIGEGYERDYSLWDWIYFRNFYDSR